MILLPIFLFIYLYLSTYLSIFYLSIPVFLSVYPSLSVRLSVLPADFSLSFFFRAFIEVQRSINPRICPSAYAYTCLSCFPTPNFLSQSPTWKLQLCLYVCRPKGLSMCLPVYGYVASYASSVLQAFMLTRIRKNVRGHAPSAHMHTYIHCIVYVLTCMRVCMHTYLRTCVRTYMHAYIHTCIHTYIHTNRHTHIYTCTYTWIYIYIYMYIHDIHVLYIYTCYIHTYTR